MLDSEGVRTLPGSPLVATAVTGAIADAGILWLPGAESVGAKGDVVLAGSDPAKSIFSVVSILRECCSHSDKTLFSLGFPNNRGLPHPLIRPIPEHCPGESPGDRAILVRKGRSRVG